MSTLLSHRHLEFLCISNIILGISMRVFLIRLTFKLVERHRLPSIMGMTLRQLVEGLSRIKRLTLPQVGKNSPCLKAFKLGLWLFPAFRLEPTSGSPGSRAHGLQPSLWLSSACWITLQISEPVVLHNRLSRFLIIDLFIYTYKSLNRYRDT